MTIKSLAKPARVVALITGVLLCIPLEAMQFTKEVNWGVGDFLAAGFLLFASGMAYVVAARRAHNPVQRRLILAVILLILGITWAELAVGIFH